MAGEPRTTPIGTTLVPYLTDAHMRFRIVVEMEHPGIEAGEGSREIGLEAGWVWGPGLVAPERVADEGRWGFGWGYEWAVERLFFQRVVGLIEDLEGRREFVRRYVETGGDVVFRVRLFGGVNIGDVLGAADMMRMAMLGIALQLEVATVWD